MVDASRGGREHARGRSRWWIQPADGRRAARGLGALPPRALGHCRAVRYDDPALVEGSARWWCHSEVVAYSDSLLEDGVDALVVAPLRRGRAALQPMVSG